MCIFCERAANDLAEGLTPSQKRQVEKCERLRERRVRATILTGFLGAGKTTFLNFVLKSLGHGQRIGVVQNEFGSVSVDDQLMLLERSEAEVVVMPNGCLCCRVRGDLVEALRRLAQRRLPGAAAEGAPEAEPLDGLLIECSGLSEVLPVAQTFFADPYVQASYQLDGVVCVCDAGNFEALEGSGQDPGSAGPDVGRLLREQLAIADVCLLNKCDLVNSSQRDRLSARMREVSPAIKVVPCRHGKVNLGQVLKIDSFSLESALSLDAHFLGNEGVPEGHAAADSSRGRQRAGPRWCDSWAPKERGAEHAHLGFASLGVELDGAVDIEAFKAWMRGVVERHGDSLVRVKGVLRTGGSAPRAIVQGVGGHIEVSEEAEQPAGAAGASARSRLVFIGRLSGEALREELREGFLGTAVEAFGQAAKM